MSFLLWNPVIGASVPGARPARNGARVLRFSYGPQRVCYGPSFEAPRMLRGSLRSHLSMTSGRQLLRGGGAGGRDIVIGAVPEVARVAEHRDLVLRKHEALRDQFRETLGV